MTVVPGAPWSGVREAPMHEIAVRLGQDGAAAYGDSAIAGPAVPLAIGRFSA
jgi:hypothetical protein